MIMSFTSDVQVFENENSVPYESYVDENDFVVEFKDVSTEAKVFIYCKGKDIEIDAARAINEDLEGIINDLSITTELKIRLDNILFSDLPIKDKRIEIRKLKSKGLSSIFVRMFMKLLEYIAEV